MAAITLAAGESTTRLCSSGEKVSYQRTLTGTSTLTPTMQSNGGTGFVAVASDALGTVASHTATFGAILFEAPTNGCTLKLANTSGAGSWVIEGLQ